MLVAPMSITATGLETLSLAGRIGAVDIATQTDGMLTTRGKLEPTQRAVEKPHFTVNRLIVDASVASTLR